MRISKLQKAKNDLIKDFGLTEEELEGKTVEELDVIYNRLHLLKTPPEEESIEQPPNYFDSNWHEYVMKHFMPEELDKNGYPKVDGLRRVAELLLGEIIESFPIQSSSSTDFAAVNWRLTISWRQGLDAYIDVSQPEPFPRRTFGAFADASPANCKPPFSTFLGSMADVRAEAKALRRALRLRTIASEEAQLGEVSTFEERVSDGNYKSESPITGTQETQIKVMCERLKINHDKLAQLKFSKVLSGLTREQAANVIVTLNKYQSSSENGEVIPDDVKI